MTTTASPSVPEIPEVPSTLSAVLSRLWQEEGVPQLLLIVFVLFVVIVLAIVYAQWVIRQINADAHDLNQELQALRLDTRLLGEDIDQLIEAERAYLRGQKSKASSPHS